MDFAPFAKRKPAPPRPMSDIIADETPAWYYRANGFIAQQPEGPPWGDFAPPRSGGVSFPNGGIAPTHRAPFPRGWLSLAEGDGADSGPDGSAPSGGGMGGSGGDGALGPVFGPDPAATPADSTGTRGVPWPDVQAPPLIRRPEPEYPIPSTIRAPRPDAGPFGRAGWFDLNVHAPTPTAPHTTHRQSHIWDPLTPQGRAELNVDLPATPEIAGREGGQLLPDYMAVYHDNGAGLPEKKFIFPDGREAVYDGDTGRLITDPRYAGTYNYVSPAIPSWNPLTWPELAARTVGHAVADVIPHYVWGTGNR